MLQPRLALHRDGSGFAFLLGASKCTTPGLTPGSGPRAAASELALQGISWAQAAPVLLAVKTPSPKAQSQVFVTAAFVL